MPDLKKNKNSDEEFEILEVSTMSNNGKNWLKHYVEEVSKASAPKQIAVGGISGCVAGYVFTKVGKLAAISIGGSLLVIQLANHQGYIKVNWTKVNRGMANAKREIEKRASRKLPWLLEEAEDFIKDNLYLATSFAGGFLIGMVLS